MQEGSEQRENGKSCGWWWQMYLDVAQMGAQGAVSDSLHSLPTPPPGAAVASCVFKVSGVASD